MNSIVFRSKEKQSTISDKFLPFYEARKIVRKLNIKNEKDWILYTKGRLPGHKPKPSDIPVAPNTVYCHEWRGFGDWLGTGRIAYKDRTYRKFKEARMFARSLKLGGKVEWVQYCKGEIPHLPPKPFDIPADPRTIYLKSGWKAWGDWVGSGKPPKKGRVFLPFEQARDFARRSGIRSSKEWAITKRPLNIPHSPHKLYANQGWEGWGDWLGTGNTFKRKFLPFKEAREFVRALKLAGSIEWSLYSKGKLPSYQPRPKNIPGDPRRYYGKSHWQGFADWLGNWRGALVNNTIAYAGKQRKRNNK